MRTSFDLLVVRVTIMSVRKDNGTAIMAGSRNLSQELDATHSVPKSRLHTPSPLDSLICTNRYINAQDENPKAIDERTATRVHRLQNIAPIRAGRKVAPAIPKNIAVAMAIMLLGRTNATSNI